MLHMGNCLAVDFQVGRDPVQAVGVEAAQGLGNDHGGIKLVRDRDPVAAGESTPGEPGTKLAPPGRLVGAFAFDSPAKPGAAVKSRIVVDADDAQMLEPAARETEQQPIHGRLVLRQVHGQEQRRKRLGNAPIRALWTARVIQERGADRRETIDEVRNQHAPQWANFWRRNRSMAKRDRWAWYSWLARMQASRLGWADGRPMPLDDHSAGWYPA